MRELTKWQKQAKEVYTEDDELFLYNTYIIRMFFSNGMEHLLNGIVFTNKVKDELHFSYVKESDDTNNSTFYVKILIGSKVLDITDLLISKNKYGSAVIKRFFKDTVIDVYDIINEHLSTKALKMTANINEQLDKPYINIDELNTYTRGTFFNIRKEKLMLIKSNEHPIKSKLVLERKDEHLSIIIENNVTDDMLKDFFTYYV